MKNKATAAWIVVFALSALIWIIPPGFADPSSPGSKPDAKRQILVLNSGYKGSPWTDGIMEGIESVFDSAGQSVTIHAEYLDTERHRPAIVFPLLKQLYAEEYPLRKLDVVIACANDAFDFVLTFGDTLFTDVPVVFSGINQFEDRLLSGRQHITGIVKTSDLAGTVALARRLHPAVKRFAVIHDTSTAGLAMAEELRLIAGGFKDYPRLDFLTDLTVADLRNALRQLGPDTLVLLLHFMRDKDGVALSAAEVRKLISESAGVPVYTSEEMYVGAGVVGGMIVRSRDQGRTAAQLALRILNGTPARAIPIMRTSPSVPVFDFKALDRFGLKLSRLPEGSEVINRPASFYKQHETIILTAAGLTLLLLLIIVTQALHAARSRKAEAILRRSEAHYRYIFESTAVAIKEENYARVKSMIDAEKARGVSDFRKFLEAHPEFVGKAADAVQVTDVNGAALRLYEADNPNQLLGPLSQSLSPEYYPAFGQALTAIAEGRDRIEFEVLASTFKGRAIHLLVNIRIPKAPEDFSRVLVCINNITGIKEAVKQLKESEQQYSQLYNNSLVGFGRTTIREGNLIECNERFAQLFGYASREQALKEFRALNHYRAPSEREDFIKSFSEYGEIGNIEICYKRKNGSICWVRFCGRINPAGGYIEGIFADINQQKATEAELEKYRLHLEELVRERTVELNHAIVALQRSLRQIGETQTRLVQSEKMAALGGLVAGVAHEINTPIGIGVTAASFLESETERLRKRCAGAAPDQMAVGAFMETVREISATVLSNLKRAADLVRCFKQVAVDQTIEERRTINLAKYINETLFTLIPKYKKTAHGIKVNCPADLELESYPGAIAQIVTNLVMNSLVHGFEGIVKGEILLDITENEGRISLRYSDNGRGMDQATLARAFEAFFTTNRKHGGTGLGLYIVYNLVTQKLDGSIECTSEPGKGVLFTIIVPRHAKALESLAGTACQATLAANTGSSGNELYA